MQIHEITRPAINEAIGDTLKAIGRNLKTSAQFALKGDEKAGAEMLKQQTDQYITNLIPQWKATWAKEEPAIRQRATATGDTAIKIKPGHRLKLVIPGSDPEIVYYKTNQGWTNDLGQPITKQSSIKALDLYANAGDAREEPISEQQTTNNLLADEYVDRFTEWAAKTLSTKESNTRTPIDAGVFDPKLAPNAKKIRDAYVANNSVLLDQAIKEYLMAQVTMVQNSAKEIRDRYLASVRAGERVQTAGISKDQLEQLADTIEKRGETVRPTGSETLDSLLRAGGLIR